MATDQSGDSREAQNATPWERTAADAGSMVADKVRRAIESADQSARELRRRALADAAADREEVHRSAALVRERIDAVQAQVTRLLDDVRDEIERIVEQAERREEARGSERARWADAAAATVDVEPVLEPVAAAPRPSPAARPAQRNGPATDAGSAVPRPATQSRRRGGLLRRRRRALPRCAVCGRPAHGDEALDRWRVARTSLCPNCQADGWQVPDHGTVPYRAAHPYDPA